jgi:hypothetical protein
MGRFEYLVVELSPGNASATATRALNAAGGSGWELVAVSMQFTSHFAWLKRRIEPVSDRERMQGEG